MRIQLLKRPSDGKYIIRKKDGMTSSWLFYNFRPYNEWSSHLQEFNFVDKSTAEKTFDTLEVYYKEERRKIGLLNEKLLVEKTIDFK